MVMVAVLHNASAMLLRRLQAAAASVFGVNELNGGTLCAVTAHHSWATADHQQ